MKVFAGCCAAALLCGLLLAFTGCGRVGEPPAAPAQSGVPGGDAASSSPAPAPQGPPAAAFAEKAETLSTNVTGVTPAGTAAVEGETWYLFDVKADVDATYLVSPDLTRIFSPGNPALDTDLFHRAANAYYPAEDAGAVQPEQEWMDNMFQLVMDDYGSSETGGWGNLILVDGAFCQEMQVLAGTPGEMGDSYGATYALTLDGRTLYRLDDEAHVFRQVDVP